MRWPSITAGYLAVLALVYAALAIYVVRLRR
jgi:predicted anti-sigma-YlaC factor YlaD